MKIYPWLAMFLALVLLAPAPPAVAQEPAIDNPTGERIFFVLSYSDDSEEGLYTVNTDGSNQTDVWWSLDGLWNPSSSRDGMSLAAIYGTDGGDVLRAKTPTGVWYSDDIDFDKNYPTWAPDGQRFAYVESYENDTGEWLDAIQFMDVSGRKLTRLTQFNGTFSGLDWSPDGTRFLFSGQQQGSPTPGIYLMATDGSALMLIGSGVGYHPKWSPDGLRIAFAAPTATTGDDIFVMNANGSNVVDITNLPGDEYSPDWSPDGTRLVFEQRLPGQGNLAIKTINSAGGAPMLLVQKTDHGNFFVYPGDPDWEGRPNVLFNDRFEYGTQYWHFQTNGQSSFSVSSPGRNSANAGRVQINKAATTIQLFETHFRLEPKTRYRLQFDAYSTKGHDLSLYVHNHSTGADYGLRNYKVNLTTGWKRFSVTFKTKGFSQLTTDTRLRFWLGPYAKAGDAYWLDNVSLEKVTTVTAASTGLGNVTGWVEPPVGVSEPIALTLVDLETEGAAYATTVQTDATGAFHIDGAPYGAYELRLSPPNGYPALEPIQFTLSEEPNEDFVFTWAMPEESLYLPVIQGQ